MAQSTCTVSVQQNQKHQPLKSQGNYKQQKPMSTVNTESAKSLASAMGPSIMSVLIVLNFKGNIDNVSNTQ